MGQTGQWVSNARVTGLLSAHRLTTVVTLYTLYHAGPHCTSTGPHGATLGHTGLHWATRGHTISVLFIHSMLIMVKMFIFSATMYQAAPQFIIMLQRHIGEGWTDTIGYY